MVSLKFSSCNQHIFIWHLIKHFTESWLLLRYWFLNQYLRLPVPINLSGSHFSRRWTFLNLLRVNILISNCLLLQLLPFLRLNIPLPKVTLRHIPVKYLMPRYLYSLLDSIPSLLLFFILSTHEILNIGLHDPYVKPSLSNQVLIPQLSTLFLLYTRILHILLDFFVEFCLL
jgi:hypothetical protein